MCFPGGSEDRKSAHNAGDLGSIPGVGRIPGRNDNTEVLLSGESPWTEEEASGLQSRGSHRVRHDWVTFPYTHRPWNPERVSAKELILAGRKPVPAFCYGSSQQCPLLFLSSSETLKEKLKINVLLHSLGLIFSFLSLKQRQKLKNLQDLRFLINILYTNCHLLSQSVTAEVMESKYFRI